MDNIMKAQNHKYHISDISKEEMNIKNGVTKTEIDYIITNRLDIVTDVQSSTTLTLEVTTAWL